MSPQQPRNNLKVEKYGGFGDSVVVKIAKMCGFSSDGIYPHPYLVSSKIREGRASEDTWAGWKPCASASSPHKFTQHLSPIRPGLALEAPKGSDPGR